MKITKLRCGAKILRGQFLSNTFCHHSTKRFLEMISPMARLEVDDLSHGCIHRLDRIDHEMDEMAAWDPVSHIGGKQAAWVYHGRC